MADVFDFYVKDNRTIQFKFTEPIMLEDSRVTDWVFHIPRTLNNLDVSGWAWWLVYINARGQKYSELLTLSEDPESPLEKCIATYSVDYGMSIKAGTVRFSLEAINAEQTGEIENEWHTKTYQTKVQDTLQGNQVEYTETESDIISALIIEVQNKVRQLVGGATPLPVNLKSLMTDHDKVYLYTGSEPNESTGYWYHWNGTDFVPGGQYGTGVTDAVPTQGSTNAVQSGGVYEALDGLPRTVTPTETDADFYLADGNGNVLMKLADGHIKTAGFDSANIETPIKESSRTEADLYICDSFGNVVGEFINGHIRTKKFNSANMDGIPEDVTALQADVSDLQTATSGIMYRTKDYNDGVYAACKFRTQSNRQFCMIIAGDCHANRGGPMNFIEYLNAMDCLDCAVMLGDIVGNVFANPIDHWTDALAIAEKPVITALGNHDVRGASSDSELWNKFSVFFPYANLAEGEVVEGKCYYYKDFADYKIRVIVLMQYDYIYTGELCFGQAQIDWFIGVLASTPSDYAVIICEHTNPSRYMAYNMDTAYTSDTWKRSNYAPTVMSGDPVPDIVNAWINGTTLSQTYGYTFENPPADLAVSADFTSRGAGEFITYLGGHWHCNVLGNVADRADQMDFHTPSCSTGTDAISGDIPRKIGTLSEDAFCALAVDRDKKLVKIFQVGAHFTNYGTSRQYFQYTYGGASS